VTFDPRIFQSPEKSGFDNVIDKISKIQGLIGGIGGLGGSGLLGGLLGGNLSGIGQIANLFKGFQQPSAQQYQMGPTQGWIPPQLYNYKRRPISAENPPAPR